MSVRILTGDCREILRTLDADSVDCVVTSPPYWGLRDYGVGSQVGLEASPADYVAVMVDVFRDVRRVLRASGTLWLNLGDSYAASGPAGGAGKQHTNIGSVNVPVRKPSMGLKPKDLVGIPWRVAFALQDDGWWLRQDIIWSKPNPMPESVTDRCTKAHEYLFLLSKSERYYFDQDAIKEPASENTHPRRSLKMPDGWDTGAGGHGSFHRNGREKGKTRKIAEAGSGIKNNDSFQDAVCDLVDNRNKRSVWTVATQPFSEAHFATFPPDLIEPCIKAGCPKGGTVLDPFFGAGTTGLVADRLGRNCIGIELNPAYVEIAQRRIKGDCPMFTEIRETA